MNGLNNNQDRLRIDKNKKIQIRICMFSMEKASLNGAERGKIVSLF